MEASYDEADEDAWECDEWEKGEQEDLNVYTGPKDSKRITAGDLRKAPVFLIRIEPEPSSIQSMEEYRAFMAPHDESIKAALSTIRRFAEQLEPKTIERMREVYYDLTSDSTLVATGLARSVVAASLNDAWNGVGPWRR